MRFDDMLATVLARQPDRLAAKVAQWRQLLDLVAQQRLGDGSALADDAIARLETLRADVPVAVRRDSALAIADRPVAAMLVAFLAGDVPQVAGELLSRARLDDGEWLRILPRLSPTARGFLRHRRDLSPILRAALAGFGSVDLALSGTIGTAEKETLEPTPPLTLVAAAPDPDPAPSSDEAAPPPAGESLDSAGVVEPFQPGGGEGQIRAIISRIARFRTTRGGPPVATDGNDEAQSLLFHFETGPDGVIRWIDGAPRGPLIGETIATPATGHHGVDAQAPGAFRRRAPFRDARLIVAGAGPAGGAWRIAGVPVFSPADGRFLGYRGTGRRPRTDERAEALGPPPVAGATPGLSPDSLRQLVHELRTPLNAIGGFAEMIRRQMRGPVSAVYRDRAQRIAEQASQLLAAIDDLDISARLDSARLELQRGPVDLAGLVGGICADQAALVRDRGASLACAIAPGLPRALGDAAALRRMVARLIVATTAMVAPDEHLGITLGEETDRALRLAVTRPARLAGVGEAELLDPGYGPEGDSPDAPLLGLGFSLHLVRRLAQVAGGALMIDDAQFALRLPVADADTDAVVGG